MFGLEILDVAIGIIFVFLLVSILCAAIREGIEAFMQTRAAYLWLGIRELLHDTNVTGLAKSFYAHPLIYSLFPGDFKQNAALKKPSFRARGRGAPAYVPSRNFALALMDIAVRGPITRPSDENAPAISVENMRTNIRNIENPAVQRALLTAIDAAKGDIERAQANIEAWYNSSMDRVSGWYKQTTQLWLFVIGLIVAVGMNIDAVTIADYLYRTPEVRQAVVKKADAYLKAAGNANATETTSEEKYIEARTELLSLGLPIGWGKEWETPEEKKGTRWDYVAPVLGWLITALAATLGAPFWFDLLNKVMVIRSTVKPHEKSPEEGSEDRQQPKAAPQVVTTPAATSQQAAPSAAPPIPQSTPLTTAARDVEWDIDGCDALRGVK